MRALQVKSTHALIADLERRVGPEALLQRRAPLLDVLRGCMRVKRGEADHRRAQHRLRKVEAVDPGVKLSLCCVIGKTSGTLCSWLHQVFRSTGV